MLRSSRTSSAAVVTPDFDNFTHEITSNYLEFVAQKRQRNQEKIRELGLDSFKESLRPAASRRRLSSGGEFKREVKRLHTSDVLGEKLRRSSRMENKAPQFPGISNDVEVAMAKKRVVAMAKKRVAAHNEQKPNRKFHLERSDVADLARQSFTTVTTEEWLEDMRRYYAETVGNSANNVQRVLTQVEKLATGRGIQHPATKRFFCRNYKVTLANDFKLLSEKASAWVCANGGDRGNGWLVEHALTKCWKYQLARYDNGGPFFVSTNP